MCIVLSKLFRVWMCWHCGVCMPRCKPKNLCECPVMTLTNSLLKILIAHDVKIHRNSIVLHTLQSCSVHPEVKRIHLLPTLIQVSTLEEKKMNQNPERILENGKVRYLLWWKTHTIACQVKKHIGCLQKFWFHVQAFMSETTVLTQSMGIDFLDNRANFLWIPAEKQLQFWNKVKIPTAVKTKDMSSDVRKKPFFAVK